MLPCRAMSERHDLSAVCVFCGSSPGRRPGHAALAEALGRALARRSLTLVYGGGRVGLMGVVADAVLAEGGRAVGVIPKALARKEVAHEGLSELEVVTTMHERKARMAELADAFLALPGGLGTLEELFETWTWGQLGIHGKPLALLDTADYFDHLVAFLDHAVAEGFVRAQHRAMVRRHRVPEDGDPGVLLDRLAAYRAPRVEKWLEREET